MIAGAGHPMRFDKFIPSPPLQPYIRQYVVSEHTLEGQYKVFPGASLVIGFQYKGRLSVVREEKDIGLTPSGITGLTDHYKIFKNSADIGTILVYFSETGLAHFQAHPVHELFNQSISLDQLFDPDKVRETEEKLYLAKTDLLRIQLVERFLLSQLKEMQHDRLILEAVRLIYDSKGTIRIKDLLEKLYLSQSPFEKRFRKVVGTSPKKFASIIRFNAVLDSLGSTKSLTEICYENDFFDQAHFIHDFRQFTGDTPEHFRRSPE